jgi:lipopolysaccharide export system protein LptA
MIKKNLAHFLNKSYIRYDDRVIKGDSLYYDRNREFASATRKKITDSINRDCKGHYAEVYKN